MAVDIILPPATRSATGDSGPIVVGTGEDLRFDQIVTASVAPTTLSLFVEHSPDGGTTWTQVGAFTQVGAVGTASESVSVRRPNSGLVRVRWAIVGTSYTFSVRLFRELP
jgi:predicted NAD/FAD-binding protein